MKSGRRLPRGARAARGQSFRASSRSSLPSHLQYERVISGSNARESLRAGATTVTGCLTENPAIPMRPSFLAPALSSALATLSLVAACGSSSPEPAVGTDAGGAEAGGADAELAPDQKADAPADARAAEAGPADGPPTYTAACTPLSAQTGTAIDTKHGRLDGYLSYVVPQGGDHSCNGDSSHVHLQVRMMGEIYDVAVDIGTFTGDSNLYEADMAIPGGAWSEGWHNDGLSYPQLGLHSTQFTPEDPTTLGQKIVTELAGINHVSIFGDAYTQGNGCHDVHYENGTADGALILEPLSPKAHILFFRFSTQSF